MSISEINKMYDGFLIFATNYETDENTYENFCIPRIVCSSRTELNTEDTIQYEMNENKFGISGYLDFIPKPNLLFI